MNWIYRNDTNAIIIYRSTIWKPNETRESLYPIPETVGLTCVQEGSKPDPVLFHDDVTVLPNTQEIITIKAPSLSHAVKLAIQCMTPNSGCECRFNSQNNCVIPIDTRSFEHTTSWENCSRIFLFNPTDNEAIISVTALEAV